MRKLLLIGFLCFPIGSVNAQVSVPLTPELYYEMGGGVQYNRPLSEATDTSSITIGDDLSLPLSCDIFDKAHGDPRAWAGLLEEYVTGEVHKLGQAVVTQFREFGTGIAIAALQRALPGVYDIAQNVIGQVEAKISVSKRSCEAVVNDINRGVNPLDGWKGLSGSVAWRRELQTISEWTGDGTLVEGMNVNILGSSQSVAEVVSAETDPIPWIEGVAGDADNPINVTEDLVTIGYNWHSNSAALTGNVDAPDAVSIDFFKIDEVLTQEKPSRLSEMFASSEDAVDWAKRFLGEKVIYLCADCESSFQPGLGLAHMITEEVYALEQAWKAIVTSSREPSPSVAQLKTVSSPSVYIHREVWMAIRLYHPQEKDLLMRRLITDVALSRVVEKAMAIRQMLLTSKDAPVVRGYKEALDNAEEMIDRIRKEIDDLMWGVETQKKLTSDVAANILHHDAVTDAEIMARRRTGRTKDTVNPRFDRPFKLAE